MRSITAILLTLSFLSLEIAADTSVIEEQLAEIGSIPEQEIVVVQRKYTRKIWRHELTPITFGGVPFGTIRRNLIAGAGYTLHISDWFAWEAINFLYAKNFFSSFTDDINANATRSGQAEIRPDIQKLALIATTGLQITPFYGKVSTLSRWIAYMELYLSGGIGIAKTETKEYFSFYPGIGLRVFFREWISLRIDFRNYLYSEEFTTRTNPPVNDTATRNTWALTFSLSFWLPKMP